MKLKRFLAVPFILLLAGLSLAACGSDSDSDKVVVSDVWARSTPPGTTTSAIYATIETEDSADSLLAASVPSDIAGKVEIHETSEAGGDMAGEEATDHQGDDDMGEEHTGSGKSPDDHTAHENDDPMSGDSGNMTMKQVHKVDIPADGTVTLEPGGLHIMLFDLAGPLKSGQTVPVTLTFEKAGEVKVDAAIRDA